MKLNRDLKLGLIYSFLTLTLLALILKFGVIAAVKISDFLQKGKRSPVENLYENILPAPQLLPLPEATNSAELKIAGYSQPNNKVSIYLNDLGVKDLETDSEGKFESFLSLSLGINKIYAVTEDPNGQKSSPSEILTVFYENQPPTLEITEPANQALIKRNPNITIKGKAAATSKVTINDHQVIINEDGTFAYPYTLQEGDNKLEILCTDPAQNQTKLEWTLRYQP